MNKSCNLRVKRSLLQMLSTIINVKPKEIFINQTNSYQYTY